MSSSSRTDSTISTISVSGLEWTLTLYLFTVALSLLSGAHGVQGWDQLCWAVRKVLTARDRRLVQGQGVRVLKDGVPGHGREPRGLEEER